ncbi:MAG: holo-ACP synthase [Planctomycetes bacterium]|nr:holo-ACP synthase [Planctomycetota bacterium]
MIIGIGTDLCEVARLKNALRRNPKLLQRLFTPVEVRYCRSHKDIYPHLAGRFAAKESFLKAIGTGWGTSKSPNWLDIEVKSNGQAPRLRPDTKCRGYGGQAYLNLHGKAKSILQRLKAKKVHLSLSHTDTLAIAVVIIET